MVKSDARQEKTEVARQVRTNPGWLLCGSLPFDLCRNWDWLQRTEADVIGRLIPVDFRAGSLANERTDLPLLVSSALAAVETEARHSSGEAGAGRSSEKSPDTVILL